MNFHRILGLLGSALIAGAVSTTGALSVVLNIAGGLCTLLTNPGKAVSGNTPPDNAG